MAKVYDIPATDLIVKLAERLKMDKKIEPPVWSAYVKDRLSCGKDSSE